MSAGLGVLPSIMPCVEVLRLSVEVRVELEVRGEVPKVVIGREVVAVGADAHVYG